VITIFGIPNCDKCRAARRWFDQNGITHQFHDLRKDGLSTKLIRDWLQKIGAAALVNRRSKTWRELAIDLPAGNADIAELLLEHPTLIKRPLVDTGSNLQVGYDEDKWLQLKTDG
jgi:Spx/MgsR family transcriptional regulator